MSTTSELNNSELNEQIINQQNQILLEISQSQPLIGVLISPSILIETEYNQDQQIQYGNVSPGFIPGLQYLSKKYLMRKVRGDGNCFYRSFLFAYLERLVMGNNCMNDDSLNTNSSNIINSGNSTIGNEVDRITKENAENELTRMINRIKTCREELIHLGYSEVAFETFHDAILELLEGLFTQTRDTLFVKFQEDGISDYYVWFMRLLTAAAIKRESDRFLPYVLDDYTFDIGTYIRREVEPMGKECEQVQIQALTEYRGVRVKIEYLDGKLFDAGKGLSAIICPESENTIETVPLTHTENQTKGSSDTQVAVSSGVSRNAAPFLIHLLYRPGHYDILYPIS